MTPANDTVQDTLREARLTITGYAGELQAASPILAMVTQNLNDAKTNLVRVRGELAQLSLPEDVSKALLRSKEVAVELEALLIKRNKMEREFRECIVQQEHLAGREAARLASGKQIEIALRELSGVEYRVLDPQGFLDIKKELEWYASAAAHRLYDAKRLPERLATEQKQRRQLEQSAQELTEQLRDMRASLLEVEVEYKQAQETLRADTLNLKQFRVHGITEPEEVLLGSAMAELLALDHRKVALLYEQVKKLKGVIITQQGSLAIMESLLLDKDTLLAKLTAPQPDRRLVDRTVIIVLGMALLCVRVFNSKFDVKWLNWLKVHLARLQTTAEDLQRPAKEYVALSARTSYLKEQLKLEKNMYDTLLEEHAALTALVAQVAHRERLRADEAKYIALQAKAAEAVDAIAGDIKILQDQLALYINLCAILET